MAGAGCVQDCGGRPATDFVQVVREGDFFLLGYQRRKKIEAPREYKIIEAAPELAQVICMVNI